MTTTHPITEELTVWLGPAAAELTDDQLQHLARLDVDIRDRYPDSELRQTALETAAQWLLGEATLDDAGHRLVHARRAVEQATAAAQQAVIMAVAAGMSESEAARRVGVTRMTVRAWLGK